jgi:hypothetical protein
MIIKKSTTTTKKRMGGVQDITHFGIDQIYMVSHKQSHLDQDL